MKDRTLPRPLSLAVLGVLGFFLLTSCVVWKYGNLLTERNRDGIPAVAGSYVDANGQTIRVSKTDFANTFLVSPPNGQSTVRVTMEPVEGSRFLVQGYLPEQVSGFPQHLLSVAEISGRKITVLFFPGLDAQVAELAKKRGVTVEMVGFKEKPEDKEVSIAFNTLTQYDSVDDLVGFFNDLFSLEGALRLEFNRK
ncbi:MAG: hypothetical protein LBO05_07970 [Deltaproteobacteria bacterium]|jgi:hypothetical protein|nr:hypothetical protein [Deltaproteobacteria bacterium]